MTSHADSIIDLYERNAHNYVADRGDLLNASERAWLDKFKALLSTGVTILDIGCGFGAPIAKYLIELGFVVEGVDASPTLISQCRERFPSQCWRVADMRALALDKKFNGIVAWDSFFHLSPDDQRRMFAVFRQHAAVGAALMFTSGPSHGEAIGSYCGEPLYHASLAAEEYQALLESNGFHIEAHVVENPDSGGHTVWIASAER